MKRFFGFFGKLFGSLLSGGGTGGVDGDDFAKRQIEEWDHEEEEGRHEAQNPAQAGSSDSGSSSQ